MAEPPPAYDAVTSPYAANNMNTVKECEVTYQQHPASEQRPGNEPSAPNYAAATAANTTTTSAPPPPATTVYVNTLVYGEFPIRMCCRYCNADILTKTTYQAGLLTWLLCGGLALFGCFLCCAVPFCMDSCQDVVHSCPACHRTLGIYRRL